MTTTTEEYWDVDGTPLHTLAFNIETLGGRLRVPPLRGSNLPIAYGPGSQWRQKSVDENLLSLAMWVRGADEDGVIPTSGTDQRTQFNNNWDQLVRLFYHPGRQGVLTKRWRVSTGLKQASASFELAGTMDATMLGNRFGARFVADLKLADPYFYGPTVVSANINAGGAAVVLSNEGHDRVLKAVVRFTGPLTNPVLTNTSGTPDIWVKYNGVIGAGEWVDLDCQLFTATKNDGTNDIAKITHDGARRWMELLTDDNSMLLTADAGAGHANVTYQPPYV